MLLVSSSFAADFEYMYRYIQSKLTLKHTYNQHQQQSCYRPEPINNSFAEACGFEELYCVLHEDGTHVSKHVGEARLMFVLI